MHALKLYNTSTHQKDIFQPINPTNIGVYVCGPTVYDLAHLGNARSAVVFDLLRDVLEGLYPKVTFVRNITDVDDKILKKSKEDKISIGELTEKTYRTYIDDTSSLGVRLPTVEPRATQHIVQMQEMITRLIERGFAYESEGHVLFEVEKNPRNGVLSGNVSDLKAGARVEVADYKRNPADFVLWKPAGDDPGWESPWGIGRPGWHIECSAMSAQYLGEHFDIHGGGADLIFPHHENEIAQSTCAHGNQVMANVWMHNGMLTVYGKKMSKSLGNFTTVRQALEMAKGRGDALRFLLLSGHYRSEIDFTQERIDESIQIMDSFWRIVDRYGEVKISKPSEAFITALMDDLNSALAISELHNMTKTLNQSFDEKIYREFYTSFALMGFPRAIRPTLDIDQTFVQMMINKRKSAKEAKDFKTADAVRQELSDLGIILEDTKEETIWRKM